MLVYRKHQGSDHRNEGSHGGEGSSLVYGQNASSEPLQLTSGQELGSERPDGVGVRKVLIGGGGGEKNKERRKL